MITERTEVSLIYTAALDGQIALLPRLSTRIKQERQRGPLLLADLGRSCAPGVWICESTGGRGMLVAMDGIGYDAFHIGALDMLYHYPALVDQIRHIVGTPFAAGPWSCSVRRGALSVVFANGQNLEAVAAQQPAEVDLVIGLRLGETSLVEGLQIERAQGKPISCLRVDGGIAPGQRGPVLVRIHMALWPEAPYLGILDQASLDLPDDLPPDPTLSGVIDFVQDEARQAERKRGQA